jgi:hypothetical protein
MYIVEMRQLIENNRYKSKYREKNIYYNHDINRLFCSKLLQYRLKYCNSKYNILRHMAIYLNLSQYNAIYRIILQHIAIYRNLSQYIVILS